RSTRFALRSLTRDAGSTSESTFSPTASAVAGLTPAPTPPRAEPSSAWWIFSVSPQNASSPNVSKRKVCRPSSMRVAADVLTTSTGGGGALLLLLQADSETASANASGADGRRGAGMNDLRFISESHEPARSHTYLS